MDMNEFSKYVNDTFKTVDQDLSYLNKIAVVKFVKDNRGNISGKCNFGLVFRHRDSETLINEGETWICELQENYNACNKQYFGKAIQKIDSSFIYDLRHDQMKEMAEYIWKTNRSQLESYIEERYAATISEKADEYAADRVGEAISLCVSEFERLKAELDEKDSLIAQQKERIAELEREKTKIPRIQIPAAEPAAAVTEDVRIPVNECIHSDAIIRFAPESIYSQQFKGERYSVHLSADLTVMTICEDENGKIPCSNGLMKIGGLNVIMPFTEQHELRAVMNEDGYNIALD